MISLMTINSSQRDPMLVKKLTSCMHYVNMIQPPNWQFKGSVINMSFGSNDDPIFQSAIQDAIAAGIVVVTSSGNANENKGSRPCG
jgi:subtilisin family serine protease